MTYLVLIALALVSTMFIGRFFAAKARLVEKEIEETIGRKFLSSPMHLELIRLREDSGVMRNLLIDMVENEASLAHGTDMSALEKARAMNARTVRRREIFGEAILALQKTDKRQAASLGFPAERA